MATVNAATLTITMDEHANIKVTGPVRNKALCYGLLECARDVIQAYGEQQQQKKSPIVSPSDLERGILSQRHPNGN